MLWAELGRIELGLIVFIELSLIRCVSYVIHYSSGFHNF